MVPLSRLHHFLDRFEERLNVDRVIIKQQLSTFVDQQLDLLQDKLTEVRARYGQSRCVHGRELPKLSDDPKVITISIENCLEHLRNKQTSVDTNLDLQLPSTSSGHGKRKKIRPNLDNKRQKTTTEGQKKFVCNFEGCRKSFDFDFKLKRHEHVHLSIKPFSCKWTNCGHASVLREDIVKHIRVKHFHLPQTLKQLKEANLEDRHPNEYNAYIEVDQQLLARRLN